MKCEYCGVNITEGFLCAKHRAKVDAGECNCDEFSPTCTYCQIREREEHERTQAELARLRAEVEILVWNLAGISTMACRRTPILYNGEMARPALDEVAELVKDYDRLRSENERMREAMQILISSCGSIKSEAIAKARAALSRVEQAKQESDKLKEVKK